jgi:nucleoside-diphosphate-sugar epimerase
MKHFNEVMGRHYRRHFGLDTVGLRFGVNYGPGGRLLAGEIRRKYSSGLIHQILEGMMLGRTVQVDMHPQTTFTWQYVKDNARCILLALSAPPTQRTVFDLPANRQPIQHVTNIVERLVPGSKAIYEQGNGQDTGLIVLQPAFEIDPTIVKRAFGFGPEYTLERGLAEQAAEVQKAPEFYGVEADPRAIS